MGAEITVGGRYGGVTGGRERGRTVIARELRGSAALVIAGLSAAGITTVADSGYIRRGYQDIVGRPCGTGGAYWLCGVTPHWVKMRI